MIEGHGATVACGERMSIDMATPVPARLVPGLIV